MCFIVIYIYLPLPRNYFLVGTLQFLLRKCLYTSKVLFFGSLYLTLYFEFLWIFFYIWNLSRTRMYVCKLLHVVVLVFNLSLVHMYFVTQLPHCRVHTLFFVLDQLRTSSHTCNSVYFYFFLKVKYVFTCY